ncbi:hypothetical protein KRP22_012615 [Phytophthora ramorum]|nr:Autophagy-related protein 2-like protein B [Phytophthora ramorum]
MQFFKQLTDPALKRLYKFVLKRMIGRFLAADELDLDQLDVHLRSGRLELCDLLLNAEVLNAELCEAQGLPFKVKKGYLGSVRVAISYANIMSESCLVEIDDIEIILVPLDKEEAHTRKSYTEATGEKAEKQVETEATAEKKPATPEPVDEISQEGLDFVASWIEQVTSKIKVTLSNICLRLETGEQHNGRDVALLCKLQWAQFTDESASEVQSVYGRSSLDHPSGMHGSQTMGGGMQSMAASTLFGISQKGIKFRGISMDLHLSCEEEGEEDRWDDRRRTEYSDMVLHPFLASDASKQCYIQVKLSHYEALEAPAMDADVFFHSIRIVLQPQYFPELGTLIDAFSADPVKLNAHRFEDRYTSVAMFKSICDDRPAWMTGGMKTKTMKMEMRLICRSRSSSELNNSFSSTGIPRMNFRMRSKAETQSEGRQRHVEGNFLLRRESYLRRRVSKVLDCQIWKTRMTDSLSVRQGSLVQSLLARRLEIRV